MVVIVIEADRVASPGCCLLQRRMRGFRLLPSQQMREVFGIDQVSGHIDAE
jgi:hypothetical protein